MRITSKGQVTIPIEIRQRLGIEPGTELDFEIDGDEIRIRRATGRLTRGQRIVENMRGKGDGAMTTDQIMALTRGDD